MPKHIREIILLTICLLLLLVSIKGSALRKHEQLVSSDVEILAKETITVMTYNMRRGVGSDGKLNLNAVIDTIKEVDPDIVLLSEVDHLMPRSQMKKQDEIIAKELGYNSIYGYNLNLISKYGNALFTKHTIKEWINTTLPIKDGVFVEPRGLIEAVIDIKGKEISVLGTHLSLKQDERMMQTEFIVERLKQASTPKLLLGDFNARPTAVEMIEIFNLMKDSTDINAKTFPSNDPQAKIDYIFVSDDIKAYKGRVIHSYASDHLPVVVEIEF